MLPQQDISSQPECLLSDVWFVRKHYEVLWSGGFCPQLQWDTVHPPPHTGHGGCWQINGRGWWNEEAGDLVVMGRWRGAHNGNMSILKAERQTYLLYKGWQLIGQWWTCGTVLVRWNQVIWQTQTMTAGNYDYSWEAGWYKNTFWA